MSAPIFIGKPLYYWELYVQKNEKSNVEMTATAETDVAEFWEYIAQDNADAATAFILRLEEQIDRQENFPERCPQIPGGHFLGTEYRHLLLGQYRVFFKIERDRAIVMRVPHAARWLKMGYWSSLFTKAGYAGNPFF